MKSTISSKVLPDTKSKLEAMASAAGTNLSAYVERVLESHLDGMDQDRLEISLNRIEGEMIGMRSDVAMTIKAILVMIADMEPEKAKAFVDERMGS